MSKRMRNVLGSTLVVACAGCVAVESTRFESEQTRASGALSKETILLNASSRELEVSLGVVLTDNDDAFESKLELIESASTSIDLAYYIFADDYSSAVLADALIEAARRGVRVRLLLDYHTNYQRLDFFSMLERYGSDATGSLEVRFYNRPTKNIVKDAVFLTMGCGEAHAVRKDERCGDAKFAAIEEQFARERIDGIPVGERNVSNLNIGGSGMFLSGFYGKDPQLMALAVSEGHDIDPERLRARGAQADAGDLDKLKELGRVYLQARMGSGLNRVVSRVKLSLAFTLYGETVYPIYAAFTGYLPVERPSGAEQARRDWDYFTDYLHHKFLLVDGELLQLGGRNIEDSYHMRPNELTDKYVFRDTDMRLTLVDGGAQLERAFERLWLFEDMVATLGDVRRHAPNDILVASKAAAAQCADVDRSDEAARADCQEKALAAQQARTLDQRLADAYTELESDAKRYRDDYKPQSQEQRSPRFELDSQAAVYYVENLPFVRDMSEQPPARAYGARNGLEGESGKHIHNLWLLALRNACHVADADSPQDVLIHNAYFFPPSNLLRQFARMVDGTLDCGNVTVTVLTNSIETTDLNVVNIAARHSIKAFAEYYASNRHATRGARFQYREYRPSSETGAAQISLHSKVMVLGSDLFIGSANADIRSYMMDSNNGLFIRDAPRLVAAYRRWLDAVLDDPSQTVDRSRYFERTLRGEMLEQDKATLRAIMAKYRAERWISGEREQRDIEIHMESVLDEIYRLTTDSLADTAKGRRAARQLNETFKAI